MRTKNQYELWRKCIYVCVCVISIQKSPWSQNKIKTSTFKSKKDFQKKDLQNQEQRNNMNGTKQKWEKQKKYSLEVWPTVTAFHMVQGPSTTVTCMIMTFLSQLSCHWLHQLSSAQLPTVSGFRPV
jgi:hypothetical protein